MNTQKKQSELREIGFDSKRITRTWQEETPSGEKVNKTFQACLGVGVTVENYADFSAKYDKAMKELFTKAGLQQEKLVYKGAELRKLFWMTGINPIAELFSALSKHVSYVDVYYSYFLGEDDEGKKHTKPLSISVFTMERDKFKKINGIVFLDMIEPAYSFICAWALLSEFKETPTWC